MVIMNLTIWTLHFNLLMANALVGTVDVNPHVEYLFLDIKAQPLSSRLS